MKLFKGICLSIAVGVFASGFVSCGKLLEKKRVNDFAEDFAEYVENNDVKEIEAVYPDAQITSVKFPSSNHDISVEKRGSQGNYRIYYGHDAWIDIRISDSGDIRILNSEGIIEGGSVNEDYNPMKLSVSNINDGPNSVLPNQAGNSYHAKNLFDGNRKSAWSVTLDNTNYGSAPKLWGPTFDVNAKKISYFVVKNGYGKNSDIYYKNTRPTWIMFYRLQGYPGAEPDSKDILYEGPLNDTMDAQTLSVRPQYDQSRPTNRIGIAFKAKGEGGYAYGSRWNDLTLNEVEVYGKP